MNSVQSILPLGFRMTLECSAANPNDPNHHLRKWKNRPIWLKVRVDQGPKFVGKDVYIPLNTHDEEKARSIRDGILHGLKAAGFLCSKIEIGKSL